jgi:hypothetical protein
MFSADLAKLHRAYHYLVMIGPSYRADMWTAVERSPELSTAELARKTYGSFRNGLAGQARVGRSGVNNKICGRPTRQRPDSIDIEPYHQ